MILLITRNYRALAAFTVVCTAILGASVGLVGIEGLVHWVSAISSPLYMEQVQQGQAWKMVSLPALAQAAPHRGPSWLTPALTYSPLLVGLGMLFLRLHRARIQGCRCPGALPG